MVARAPGVAGTAAAWMRTAWMQLDVLHGTQRLHVLQQPLQPLPPPLHGLMQRPLPLHGLMQRPLLLPPRLPQRLLLPKPGRSNFGECSWDPCGSCLRSVLLLGCLCMPYTARPRMKGFPRP